jgi:hypothetical protein
VSDCDSSDVRQNVKRRQVGGAAAEMFNYRSKELEQAAAQPADTVVEHQVNGFGVEVALARINQSCSNINEHVH